MKRYLAFMGSAMFCVVCFSMYLMLESTTSTSARIGYDVGQNDMNSIERKMAEITADLEKNQRMISLFKEAIQAISTGNTNQLKALQAKLKGQLPTYTHQDTWPEPPDDDTPVKLQKDFASNADSGSRGREHLNHVFYNQTLLRKMAVEVPVEMCSLARQSPVTTDVQIHKEIESGISFDNAEGGVWKQGYPIVYDVARWKDKPLKVFVVPHSHNDPGWIKTFERYYNDQTRHILDNMITKLEQFPRMRFIYAEISFFSLWWKDLDSNRRERVKNLIKKGQLEIVTGGWVMTDEANAHYYAMIDQMIEGHDWLQRAVGVAPESGWAIDPFGHSPTMAYLLQRMGVKSMLIQRTHYAVKKYLSKKQSLEFRWRQSWDHNGTTDMFAHMMPFYSYDVPHTCGPDPKLCCQFDFKRLPGGRVNCPWKVAPVAITEGNVASKAEALLDQYRKKSTLFRNNVVLVPLGDDFRFDKAVEWDQQYQNYQKLFDYMNGRKDWHVEAQFGTLADYFRGVRERSGVAAESPLPSGYPSLSGDFYTYADRDDHYWSGYFTSRPFYKRLDRVLEAHLRGAEILYSLAAAQARSHSNTHFPALALMKPLVGSRRNLGLFQHHDGITGTAKDFVVVDYGNKLISSLAQLKDIIRQSAQYLLTPDPAAYSQADAVPMFDVDEIRQSHDSLPERNIVELTDRHRPVVLYNSLGHATQSIVRVYVDNPHVEVKDPTGNVIMSQVDPFWINNLESDQNVFKCVFTASVPAMGLSRYSMRKVASASDNPQNSLAVTTLYNSDSAPATNSPFVGQVKSGPQVVLESADLKLTLDTTNGMMKSVFVKESKHEVNLNADFVMYGTRRTKEKSGAYLFLPDGEAKPITHPTPFMRVIEGPLLTEAHVFLPHVEHNIRLLSTPGVDSLSIEVQNIVDIRHESNKELAMRFQTNIENGNVFYSDLNGFQVLKRKTLLPKLPLQANFYPMPALAFIQDSVTRFSVLTAQSLGVASLKEGWLEVMQDRRLNQDDGRGLGQGLIDNKRTPNKFRILIEKRTGEQQLSSAEIMGYPSLVGHMTSLELIHPLHVLPPLAQAPPPDRFRATVTPLKGELPCEVHPVTLRSLQVGEDTQFRAGPEVALLLHRLGVDCNYPTKGITCKPGQGKIVLGDIFKDAKASEMKEMSLSLLHTKAQISQNEAVVIPPMEVKSFKFTLS